MSDEQQLSELFMDQFHLDAARCTRETTLDELAVDSLEIMEFVIAVEELFDIELDEAEIEDCITLGDAADLILNKIKEE